MSERWVDEIVTRLGCETDDGAYCGAHQGLLATCLLRALATAEAETGRLMCRECNRSRDHTNHERGHEHYDHDYVDPSQPPSGAGGQESCGACADGLDGRPSNHTCEYGDEEDEGC